MTSDMLNNSPKIKFLEMDHFMEPLDTTIVSNMIGFYRVKLYLQNGDKAFGSFNHTKH